jgi:hypothetical protein
MLYYRFTSLFFLLYFSISNAWCITPVVPKFTVYAYIPWKIKTKANQQALSDYFSTKGIKPIYVMYENTYFNHGTLSLKKIKELALLTSQNPDTPVSFDMEFGDRFKPETVIPRIKTILHYFRHYNSKSLVGIYATIPQNAYGLPKNTLAYNTLNRKYDTLIHDIDFISPSLYNYNGHDFNSWYAFARFTMTQAKQYKPNKPIIPYISPIVRLGPSLLAKNGNLVEELTEQEMSKRLQTLADLGASGCIIWASSQDRTKDGEFPQFSPSSGWGKAVTEFIAKQPTSLQLLITKKIH